jgi:hypothetical protein
MVRQLTIVHSSSTTASASTTPSTWPIATNSPSPGYIRDLTGTLDYAFYISGGLLFAAILLSRFVHRPAAARK